MADRYKKVEGWLEDGNTGVGAPRARAGAVRAPEDGRVRYMLGRVAYADDKRDEALGHYREAIALDAGFRGDPVLLAHLDTLIGRAASRPTARWTWSSRRSARRRPICWRRSPTKGADLTRRQRAAAALDDIGEGKRVDQVSLSILELKKAQSCEEKKVIVAKLNGLGDVRALPALRALGGRRLGPLRFGGADTRCMKKELPEAIAALDEKEGGRRAGAARRGGAAGR